MLKRALFFFKRFNFFNLAFLQLVQNLILTCQSLAGVQERFIILRSMSNCFCTTHKDKLDLQAGFHMSTVTFLLPNNMKLFSNRFNRNRSSRLTNNFRSLLCFSRCHLSISAID